MPQKTLLLGANKVLDAVIAKIQPNQWDSVVPSTPLWTLKQLVNHVAYTNIHIASQLCDEPDVSTQDNLDAPDPLIHWRSTLSLLNNAIAEFDDYDKLIDGPGGLATAAEYLGIISGDRFAHAWDISHGTGIELVIPEELLQQTYEYWLRISPNVVRGQDLGEVVETPTDASTLAKFLALTGRDSCKDHQHDGSAKL